MSRHRNVRAMNIDEEYEGYYDSAYGHSVEEEFCISPQTEAQFLYNRDAQKHSMSAFLDAPPDSPMDEYSGNEDSPRVRCDSINERPNLSGIDRAKLQSCVEAMQNVVGETISENILIKAATENHFDLEKALDAVLSGSGAFEKPKPPRNRNVAAARKEFCIHSKYASPDYIGWDSKINQYKYSLKPYGCIGYPSIYDPLILNLLKMFIAFELFPTVEKQYCCGLSAGSGFSSHLKSFYSLLVPFFTKFSSSDVFTRRYYKIRKRLRRLIIDFKNELRILELLCDGYVANEKYSGKTFYCISKLLKFFLELLHMHSAVTNSSLLSTEEQSHLTDIFQVFQFHLSVTIIMHSSSDIPSTHSVWFHCKNHSITNTVTLVKWLSTEQKPVSSVDNKRSNSVIRKFLSSVSHHGFVNCPHCKIFHVLHRNEHNIVDGLSLIKTDYSNKGVCHVVYEIENICDPRNTHLEAYVNLLLHLLSNILARSALSVNTLQTVVQRLKFNTVKYGNSSSCKYQLRKFYISVRDNEHHLVKILNFIHNRFCLCENDSKEINYVLSHTGASFSGDKDIEQKNLGPRRFVKNPSNFLKEIHVLSEDPVFLCQVCFETKHPCRLQYEETMSTYNKGKFAPNKFLSTDKKVIWRDGINGDYSKMIFCKYMCRPSSVSSASKALFEYAVNLSQIVRGYYDSLHFFMSSNENQYNSFLGVHMKFMDNVDSDTLCSKNIYVLKLSNEIILLFNKCLELSQDQSCTCSHPPTFASDVLQRFASGCTLDALDIFLDHSCSNGRVCSEVRDSVNMWKKMVYVPAKYMKPDLISCSDCDVLSEECSGKRQKHCSIVISGSCESYIVILRNEKLCNYFIDFKCPVKAEYDTAYDISYSLSGAYSQRYQKLFPLCPVDHHVSHADHVDSDAQSTKLSMETETKEMVPSIKNLVTSELSFPDTKYSDCGLPSGGHEKFADFVTTASTDSECTVESCTSLNVHLSGLSVSENSSNESTDSCSDLESCDDLSLDDLFVCLKSDSRDNLLSDTENCTLECIDTNQDCSVRNRQHTKTDSGIDVDSDVDIGNDFSPSDLCLSMESLGAVDESATSFEGKPQEFPSSYIPFLTDPSLAEKIAVVTAVHRPRDILQPDISFSPEYVALKDHCDKSENAHAKIQSSVLFEPSSVRHNWEFKDHNLKYDFLSFDNCTVADNFNCDPNIPRKLANEDEQPQQSDNLLLNHNHNVSSEVNDNQCYNIGNEQHALQHSLSSDLCFDDQDDTCNEKNILKCTHGSDMRNELECVDGSSDVQSDVLNKSLSKMYLNFTKASENSGFLYSSSELFTLSPLDSHNSTEPPISTKCPSDVQNETSTILLSSAFHDSEAQNFSECDLKVHDKMPCSLSDLFNQANCGDILRNSDITTSKSESSNVTYSDSFHMPENYVDNASEKLSCDFSFLNSFNNCNDNGKSELSEIMDSNMEQTSFSGISLSDLYLDNKCISISPNSTGSDLFHLSCACSAKNEVTENTWENENYNSPVICTNLKLITTDSAACETGEQDHPVENIALSDLCFKIHSEAEYPSKSILDDELSRGSLLDSYSVFKPEKETKDNYNTKHAVDPDVSLSELYHSMKPVAQGNFSMHEKNSRVPSPSFDNLCFNLEPNAPSEFVAEKKSSLLDFYINSESDKYDCGSGATTKKLTSVLCNSENTGVSEMDELGCDNLRTKMTTSVCRHDFESDEVDSGNSSISDADSLNKRVSDFFVDQDCTYMTDVSKKGDDIPIHATLTAHETFQQTLHPVQPCMLQISEPVGDNHIDMSCIDLSVVQKHPYKCPKDFYESIISLPNEKLPDSNSVYTKSRLPSYTESQEIEVTVKTKRSLFAKVLKSKSKPAKKHPVPKPPQTLPEILKSIGYDKYFQFSTPSPDEVGKTEQNGAVSCPGSSSTIKPPNLETVDDEKEFVFNRETSGRMVISNGEIKTPDDFESGKNKPAISETGTDCDKAVEKSDVLPSSVEEKGKMDEQSSTAPVEQLSKLKINADDKEVLEAYKKERGGNKPLINLVVIGHVDAGKSTLMGHLLYRLGCVGKKMMHKYEQDSKKLGKSSFMYAWVLDETSEERNRGITMDVAQSRFETPHRSVTLLDAPGHKDFIPNMITGAAQADVAVLVLDSTRGEFETGFEAGGQTREHTMLIRSLGVSQLAVAVNKLDNVNWDQERYKEIVSKLSVFLKQAGFKESEVQFVPCSGLTGENLVKPPETPELKKWYSGPCLVDVIDCFKPPERPVSKSFRFCISDVFKGMGSGFCVSGRVEAGYVQNGDKVLVMPASEQATVKGITIDETNVQHSFAGDHVTLQLSGVDMNNVMTGCVVCDIARPVKVSAHFQARLVIFNITVPITKGFPVILHYQSMSEQAFVKKLISQLHRSTGQVVKKKPRCLTKNSSAVVEIEVVRPICVEVYKDFKELGRFMLRSGGSTIAAGLVTEIL